MHGAEEDEAVVLRGGDSRELAADGSDSRDGEDVVAIELRRPDGSCRHDAVSGPPVHWVSQNRYHLT